MIERLKERKKNRLKISLDCNIQRKRIEEGNIPRHSNQLSSTMPPPCHDPPIANSNWEAWKTHSSIITRNCILPEHASSRSLRLLPEVGPQITRMTLLSVRGTAGSKATALRFGPGLTHPREGQAAVTQPEKLLAARSSFRLFLLSSPSLRNAWPRAGSRVYPPSPLEYRDIARGSGACSRGSTGA